MDGQAWYNRFRSFTDHMRSCGWPMPFMMVGSVFRPVGFVPTKEWKAANG